MEAATAPMFTGWIRWLGFGLAAPSVAGVICAMLIVILMVHDWCVSDATIRASFFGSPYGNALGLAIALGAALGGLVLGSLAWSFLRHRCVYRCARCASLLERK